MGQNRADANYGISEFSYDAARRKELLTDQPGDTRANNFDMANRLTSRDYRLRISSPAGSIADSDSFEYDDARRVTKATSGRYTNVVDLAYDNASQLTSESLTIAAQTDMVASEHDDANHRIKLT